MAKPQILLLGEIENPSARAHWAPLASSFGVVEPQARSREEFIAECKAGAFDGVKVAYRTFMSVATTGLIDEELVKALPASLGFVCNNGAGYDQISIEACSSRNIRVSNTPVAVDDATADANIFLILGALRGFNSSMFALRRSHWKGSPPPPLGHDPQGKTLGILGMGGIGRNLARKAAVFGMTTQYYNRTPLPAPLSGGASYVSFDDLLATSDVLSLNLPLNKATRHIISTAEFAKMKKGIVIVNTARGAVMDEAALVEALDAGRVAAVGLDVFEDEPAVHPGLVRNEKAMLLPHMGTWTVETQQKMEVWTMDNVRRALEQGKLVSIVPEQRALQEE